MIAQCLRILFLILSNTVLISRLEGCDREINDLNQSLTKDPISFIQDENFINFFKRFFLTQLGLTEEPRIGEVEDTPGSFIESFKAKSDSSDKIVPILTRTQTDWFRGRNLKLSNGFEETNKSVFFVKIERGIFRDVNHVKVDVYIPGLKVDDPKVKVINDEEIRIKGFEARKDENDDWLVASFKVFYLDEKYNGNALNIGLELNKKNFKDLSALETRGALVYITAPTMESNINTRETKCQPEVECCPSQVEVNFDELGWGRWILKPKIFKLSYCSGPCKNPQKHYTTQSSILWRMIALYKEKAPKNKLCCAPLEMLAYSILYYDHDGVIQSKKIQDMEVKSCICT